MKKFLDFSRSPIVKAYLRFFKRIVLKKHDTPMPEIGGATSASELIGVKKRIYELEKNQKSLVSFVKALSEDVKRMEKDKAALRNSIIRIAEVLGSGNVEHEINRARDLWNLRKPLERADGWQSEEHLEVRAIGQIEILVPKNRDSVNGISPWFEIEHYNRSPMQLVQVAFRCGDHVVKGIIQR